MKKIFSKFLLSGFCIINLIVVPCKAQNLIDANPADMFDYKSAIINPGIIPYLPSHMMAGIKVYHFGFLKDEEMAFKNGFCSFSSPFSLPGHIGFGLNAQYFNTPMLSRNFISLQLARRFFGFFAIGAKANFFGTSYNESNFHLVDANDPVFANGLSKWNFSSGVGIALFPFHFLTIGASIDHLNQPDISFLGEGIKKEREISGGIVLRYGGVRFSSGFTMVGNKIKPNGIFEAGSPLNYVLRLGLIRESARIETQLHIVGPISLNYSYDYPVLDFSGFSNGSHQFSLIYEFSRNPDLPEPLLLNNSLFEFKKPIDDLEPRHHFYVYSSEESLEIIEKKLKRTIEKGVTREILARLSKFELGHLDSARIEKPIPLVKKKMTPLVDDLQLEGSYSRDYTTALSNLKKSLSAAEDLQSSILVSSESIKRGVRVRNYISENLPSLKERLPIAQTHFQADVDSLWLGQKQGYRPILPQEQLIRISTQSTIFHIVPVNISDYSGQWKLTIESVDGQVFKEFSGDGKVPTEIKWNWRSDDGRLISAGFYYYYLTWYTESGSPVISERNRLYVQKLLRTINVKVTREHPKALDDADEIDIFLKR